MRVITASQTKFEISTTLFCTNISFAMTGNSMTNNKTKQFHRTRSFIESTCDSTYMCTYVYSYRSTHICACIRMHIHIYVRQVGNVRTCRLDLIHLLLRHYVIKARSNMFEQAQEFFQFSVLDYKSLK